MTRAHHLTAVLGILAAALGAGSTWWSLTLTGGGVVGVTGVDSSALLWSVGAVCLAAYGLQAAMRGISRRVAGGVQVAAALVFCAVALSASADPLPSALAGITTLTGIAGVGAAQLVVAIDITGWHLSAVGAGALLAVSGVLGAIRADRVALASRFERGAGSDSPQDSVSAWDALSDGSDPTKL